MLEKKQIVMSSECNEQDVSYIWNGIRSFNSKVTKSAPPEVFNIVMRDEELNIVAGLLCKSYLKGFYVDLLWIDENYRKLGFGSKLLRQAEEVAKERECNFIYLDTFSFQALEFYKKSGFEVFGTLSGFQDGIQRYYLRKSI